ncbi:ribonuclease P [Haematococcus lacustris]|uniref:Ribonuclease P n=1 Tax=Haematococcus lacustris TaxID=44745 RepID=A0A699Z4I7_HAELA|nr:ribonuclease P [Haematococcus lacustris]
MRLVMVGTEIWRGWGNGCTGGVVLAPLVQMHRRPRCLLHSRRNVANQSTRVKAAESSHREASESRDVPVSIESPPGTEKQPSADLEAQEEVTFYEGSGAANAELVLSCLLGLTLVYAPLTIASIGRRLWIQYRFTNKRLIITNTSPLFKSQTQVAYSQVKEVRSVPRGFGAWGDMVIFLQGGGQLELLGMEKHAELKDHRAVQVDALTNG